MSLAIATAIYHLRKSRPLEYYLTPTVHLLEDLKNSNINICLFTDQNPSLFPQAENIHIFNPTPDELIKGMWDNPNWREEYRKNHRNPYDPEQRRTDLIAVWLGKFKMMEIASQYSTNVLWQDAGIKMPSLKKDFTKYKKVQADSQKYNDFTQDLLSKHPLVFMSCDKYINHYQGVFMDKYSKRKDLIRAGFILARASEVSALADGVREKWDYMISRGYYGTEENSLSLVYWSRKDIGVVSYDLWLEGLGLK